MAELWQDLAKEIMTSEELGFSKCRITGGFAQRADAQGGVGTTEVEFLCFTVKKHRSKPFFDHFAEVVMCRWKRVGFKEKQTS